MFLGKISSSVFFFFFLFCQITSYELIAADKERRRHQNYESIGLLRPRTSNRLPTLGSKFTASTRHTGKCVII